MIILAHTFDFNLVTRVTKLFKSAESKTVSKINLVTFLSH